MAALLWYQQQDLQLIPLLNFKHESYSSDQTANSGNVGRSYINTTAGGLRYHRDASTIVRLDIAGLIANSDIAAGAAIALSKLATDPLARANHTGSQTASTISDLATVVQAYRLDQFAAPTSAVNINSQRLTSVSDPSSPQDAATKNYVDNSINTAINGHDWKDSVKAATTANITLSGTQTIDGIALSAGDRVLVKNQTTASANGIYVVAAGAWARSSDADNTSPTNEVTAGMTVPVEGGGTTNGGTVWIITTAGTITLNTTSITFTQIGAAGATYTASGGITLSGNNFTLDLVTVARGGTNSTTAGGARTNLGANAAGGIVAQNAALTAGTEATFSHSFGVDGQATARDATSKQPVGLVCKCSSTNIKVTADVAVSSGVLEFVFTPAGS